MRNKAGAQLIILIILMLVSLSLAGGIFYLYQKEQTLNVSLRREKEELNLNIKIAQANLDESQKEVATLGLKLNESQAQIETLTGNLEQEKNTKEEALTQIRQLKIHLEEQKGLRGDLENKLKQAENDLGQIRVKLNDLESQKAELETKVKGLEEQAKQAQTRDVELGKIVVSPDAATSAEALLTPESDLSSELPSISPSVSVKEERQESPSGLTGKVLVLNKEYNFAVINLGSADGVNIGDLFSVYHNNNYVGDVKIEKVHDSMSAAGFVSTAIKDNISEGDKVAQQIK
jgi:hypothetical protein